MPICAIVPLLSHVRLFAWIPWNAAHQASLFLTISQSLPKFKSIESVMPSNLSSSVTLFSFCLHSFPASVSFPMSQLFSSDGQSIGASTCTDYIYECLHICIYHSFIQQIRDDLFYCWQDARCHLTVTKLVYFFLWSPMSIFSTGDHKLSDLIPQLKTKGQNSGFSVSLGILIVPLKVTI